MRKYVKIYNKNYDHHGVWCLIKILTYTNNNKYFRIITKSNLHYSHYIPEKILLKRIDKDGNNFSQKLEMKISFMS